MKTPLLWLLVIAATEFNQPLFADTQHRSQIRVRDPFVLPDSATKTYFIYNSTTPAIDSTNARKAVVVYQSKDLENWETPVTVFEVPEDHWGREMVWAPEVHRYQGKYYLFVTLTSKDTLPTPEGRPQNVKRGTEILVADRPEGRSSRLPSKPKRLRIGWRSTARCGWRAAFLK